MSRIFIYLAGPIAGLNNEEANDWRDVVSKQLSENGITGVSPLRCEPPNREGLYDDQLSLQDRQDWFVTPRCIHSKNWMDSDRCDAVFVYYPKNLTQDRPSYGTVIEIGWGIALRKPVFVCSDNEYLIKHPLVDRNVAYIGDNIENTVQAIVDLYGVYT